MDEIEQNSRHFAAANHAETAARHARRIARGTQTNSMTTERVREFLNLALKELEVSKMEGLKTEGFGTG